MLPFPSQALLKLWILSGISGQLTFNKYNYNYNKLKLYFIRKLFSILQITQTGCLLRSARMTGDVRRPLCVRPPRPSSCSWPPSSFPRPRHRALMNPWTLATTIAQALAPCMGLTRLLLALQPVRQGLGCLQQGLRHHWTCWRKAGDLQAPVSCRRSVRESATLDLLPIWQS